MQPSKLFMQTSNLFSKSSKLFMQPSNLFSKSSKTIPLTIGYLLTSGVAPFFSLTLITSLPSFFAPQSLSAQYYRQTPYCHPCTYGENDGSCHVFMGLEGVAWKVDQKDVEYAILTPLDDDEGSEKTYTSSFDWAPGIRAWFGWNWGCGWDLRLSYTYYENKSCEDKTPCNDDYTITPTMWTLDVIEPIISKATCKQYLKYQSEEFLIGNTICFYNNSIITRPYIGLQLVQLDQNCKTKYEGTDFFFPVDEGEDPNVGFVRWNSDLDLTGIHGGIDIACQLRCGLGLYADVSGSCLAGKAVSRHKQYAEEYTPNYSSDSSSSSSSSSDSSHYSNKTTLINLRDKDCFVVPSIQIKTGISYQTSCGDSCSSRFRLGYEYYELMNLPLIPSNEKLTNDSCNTFSEGNLRFQGVTLSFDAYF